MLANAIPIYLGAPDVVEHFNPASFIHVGAFANWEHAVAKIKELDRDLAKYKAMLREPWLHNNLLNTYFQSTYCDEVIRSVINQPFSLTITAVPRVRIGPSITSSTARILRHIAHNRVGFIRAIRPPVVKIASVIRHQRATNRRPNAAFSGLSS
jgi:hypothetical protein